MFRKSECSQTRELLSPYLDGRLSPKDQQRLDDHLRSCESCASELESLRATVNLLRLTPVVRPPRSFAIREQMVATPRWQAAAILRWSTGLAMALLIVLVGGDILSSAGLGGVPASAPQMVQKSAERTGATMSESSDASKPVAPAAMPTSQPSGAASGAVQPSPTAAAGADALRVAPSQANTQPTTVAPPGETRQATGTSQPILRMAEIGLGVLVLTLVALGLLMRRFGGR